MRDNVLRRVGHVPSPTPMMGVFGDSTNVTLKPADMRLRCFAAITPAVSHPAVPPPTITILCTGRTICSPKQIGDVDEMSTSPLALHPEARPQRVTPAVCEYVEHLIVEATVRAQRLVRDIQCLEEQVELLRELITGADVDLQARVHERRLGTKRRVVLVLAELQQILVTPVAGDTHLEAVLVIERDQVRRVRQARYGEAALRNVVAIIGLVGIHQCHIRVEAEAGIAEHVLPRELETIDRGIRTVDPLRHRVDGGLASGW